ncbi:MAG TPA: AMP-binding protein [Spirochaetia bacterium]|nr:AMP-binding protein [Spirochaetia bacterium]
MLERFVEDNFTSYEDFRERFSIRKNDDFNFAYDVVDVFAEEEPDKRALVYCNDAGDERVFTFAQMREYSNRAANFFVSAGIGPGDPVMLILKRRYQFWFCLLGLHKIGAIAVPATHLLTDKDISFRNNAASIKMIVCVNEAEVIFHVEKAALESPTLAVKALVGGSREGWLDFDSMLGEMSPVFQRPREAGVASGKSISLLYFTSGTTGNPKMVQHDFTYPLSHIVTAKYWQNVKNNGLHLTVSDTGWAKAMWGKIYGQWIAGCAVFVYDMDKFIPERLLEKIARFGVTSFCAPPTIYRYLIKEDISAYDLSKLEYCTTAGEPLNPEVYNRFLSFTGLKLKEGYGQTELTVVIANFPWMEEKPGSMGKPTPGYHIDIVTPEGKPCDVGETGEIVVRLGEKKPLGMFAGYYRDPALTAEAMRDGVYHTGDTAWKDEDGYFWFVGRMDDVIKSSGYRIGPFEVESALLTHPAVLECAITAVPDPDRGQVVKATVVLTKGYTPGDDLAKELQEHVKKVTAPYKYPRVVEFVDELPKTISGKIRRVDIREKDTKRDTR